MGNAKGKRDINVEKALIQIEKNVDALHSKSGLVEMMLESPDPHVWASMQRIYDTYKSEIGALEELRKGLSGYIEVQKPPRYAVINDELEVDVIVDPHAG